jgi:hypothetical protein
MADRHAPVLSFDLMSLPVHCRKALCRIGLLLNLLLTTNLAVIIHGKAVLDLL